MRRSFLLPRPFFACVVAFCLAACLVACATTERPPARSLAFEQLELADWNGRRITLTGRVDGLEHSIADAQGSFRFVLIGSTPDDRVLVTEAGYNAEVLSEAVGMLLRVEQRGIPATVTGTVRIAPGVNESHAARLEIDTLEIQGRAIDTDRNDHQRARFDWGYEEDQY